MLVSALALFFQFHLNDYRWYGVGCKEKSLSPGIISVMIEPQLTVDFSSEDMCRARSVFVKGLSSTIPFHIVYIFKVPPEVTGDYIITNYRTSELEGWMQCDKHQ